MRESHAESSRGQPSNDYKALKTSNDLSESTIEGIKYALVVLSRSHREGLGIVRSNRQFRETFQLLPDVKPGTPLTEALPNSGLEAIVEQGMTSGEAIREVEFSYSVASDSSSRRHRQGRGDSEERHFLLAISKINAPSSCRGVLVTFDEITEWKRRQFQVMEASRLVSIGEMAAGVAHEINNPLAAVMGFAQLVLRRDVDSSVQRDVERVLAEAKRASKIIANLQSFARRYKPKKDPVVMSRVLQKVLDFRAYELQVNNIEVINKFDSDTPRVMGDKHQLEQVILNIVTNAEQFMFEANGGGRLTVEIGKIKSKVRVSIGDDGPGIERKNLPKIFDPFFTTKEVGRGSGLGLSVCYGIVHEHDGIIRVDSSPGQGATQIPHLDKRKTSLAPATKRAKMFLDQEKRSPTRCSYYEARLTGIPVRAGEGLDGYDGAVRPDDVPGVDASSGFEVIGRAPRETAGERSGLDGQPDDHLADAAELGRRRVGVRP